VKLEIALTRRRGQSGEVSQRNCARNSVGMRGSFYRGRGLDSDVNHDIQNPGNEEKQSSKARITRVTCTELRDEN
jgi:hypothetical protein